MKSNSFKFLFLILVSLAGSPVWADHGSLLSTVRDNWIDMSVNDLVSEGIIAKPAKPLSELTNLEVAQLTAQAADIIGGFTATSDDRQCDAAWCSAS